MSSFQKGHKKVGGRHRGTPNKSTVMMYNNTVDRMATYSAKEFNADWKKLSPMERMKTYCNVFNKVFPSDYNINDETRNSESEILDILFKKTRFNGIEHL